MTDFRQTGSIRKFLWMLGIATGAGILLLVIYSQFPSTASQFESPDVPASTSSVPYEIATLPAVDGQAWSHCKLPTFGLSFDYPSYLLSPQPGDWTEPNRFSFFSAGTPGSNQSIQIITEDTQGRDLATYFGPSYSEARNDLSSTTVDGVPAVRQFTAGTSVTTFSVIHDGKFFAIIIALPVAGTERVIQSVRFYTQ